MPNFYFSLTLEAGLSYEIADATKALTVYKTLVALVKDGLLPAKSITLVKMIDPGNGADLVPQDLEEYVAP